MKHGLKSRTAASGSGISIGLLIGAIMLLYTLPAAAESPLLDQWKNFSRTGESRQLLSWLRCKTNALLTGGHCDERITATPPYYGQLGIFVTLMKGGRVRGCFGAFDHKSDAIERILDEYLHGALRCDPRYAPVDIAELPDLKYVLTVAGEQYAVEDINSVDISRFGIILTLEDNERVVFVPAEMRSVEYLKSRIRGMKVRQIASFRTVVLR